MPAVQSPLVRRSRRRGFTFGLTVLVGGGLLAVPSAATAHPSGALSAIASTSACPALQTRVTVDRGDSGSAVGAVQCALRGASNEFADLAVDSRFGPATQSAVTAFQSRRGLSADGVVGPATYRALTAAPVPDGDPQVQAAGPTLRRGDVGTAVRALQSALGVTNDGMYGRQTETSVAAFQGRQGLVVDGVFGPRTRQALVANGVDGF